MANLYIGNPNDTLYSTNPYAVEFNWDFSVNYLDCTTQTWRRNADPRSIDAISLARMTAEERRSIKDWCMMRAKQEEKETEKNMQENISLALEHALEKIQDRLEKIEKALGILKDEQL